MGESAVPISFASPTGTSSVTTRAPSACFFAGASPGVKPTLRTVTLLCVCLSFGRSASVVAFTPAGLPIPSAAPPAARLSSAFLPSTFFGGGGVAPHSRETEL